MPHGSPPRTWGRRSASACGRTAYYGSPPRTWGRLSSRQTTMQPASVHPHARGEDCTRRSSGCMPSGSPPRTWGRRRSIARRSRLPYGSPPRTWGRRCASDDSARCSCGSPPRTWGRRTCDGIRSRLHHGSPPRTWGRRPLARRRLVTVCGSPPRTWGRRRPHAANRWRLSVHPHARGEDAGRSRSASQRVRFTPTHVGKTSTPSQMPQSRHGSPPRTWGRRLRRHVGRGDRSVHPHARGEDAVAP